MTNYIILLDKVDLQKMEIEMLKELNKEYEKQIKKTWWDRYKGYVCFILGIVFMGGVVSITK